MNSVKCSIGNFKGMEITVGMEVVSFSGCPFKITRIETTSRNGQEVVLIMAGSGLFYEMDVFAQDFSPIL